MSISKPSPHPVAQRHPDIAALVESFYTAARQDPLLGPVFNARVTDWPHHFTAITAFWAAQLRGRGTYRGQPIAAHQRLAAAIHPDMFTRWLVLWQAKTTELMPPADAEVLQAKAARIATVLAGAIADTNAKAGAA